MQYVLICNVPITETLQCGTGFKAIALTELMPSVMMLSDFQEVAPISLVFLATCWVYKTLSKQIDN